MSVARRRSVVSAGWMWLAWLSIFFQIFCVLSLETPRDVRSCRMSKQQACSLAGLLLDEPTLIYPGGRTRCLFSTSTEYAFQVWRGDSDKLLIFFQGGGACWNQVSTAYKPPPCHTSIQLQPSVGIFDRINEANPFRRYTVVHVQHCSGDMHLGDSKRWYVDDNGEYVQQRGFLNVQAAVAWSKANTREKLDSLVISGCSTGAVAAPFWSLNLLHLFHFERAAVISDSYSGVFPGKSRNTHRGEPSAEGGLLHDIGACQTGLLPKGLQMACEEEFLTVPSIFEAAMRASPNAAFAAVNTKADQMQIAVYRVFAKESLLPGSTLQPQDFYAELNVILERYHKHPNFASYLIDGDVHCLCASRSVLTTDTRGWNGTEMGEREARLPPPLVAWLGGLAGPAESSAVNQCHGPSLPASEWTGTKYCDSSLAFRSNGSGDEKPDPTFPHEQLLKPTTGSSEVVQRIVNAVELARMNRRTNWAWYYWLLVVTLLMLLYGAAIENGVPLPLHRWSTTLRHRSSAFVEFSDADDGDDEDWTKDFDSDSEYSGCIGVGMPVQPTVSAGSPSVLVRPLTAIPRAACVPPASSVQPGWFAVQSTNAGSTWSGCHLPVRNAARSVPVQRVVPTMPRQSQ